MMGTIVEENKGRSMAIILLLEGRCVCGESVEDGNDYGGCFCVGTRQRSGRVLMKIICGGPGLRGEQVGAALCC